jgi:hypothetical protein
LNRSAHYCPEPKPPSDIAGTLDHVHFADGQGHVVMAPVSAQDVLNAVRAALASPTPDAAEGGETAVSSVRPLAPYREDGGLQLRWQKRFDQHGPRVCRSPVANRYLDCIDCGGLESIQP